jgi:hypothetical protein
MRLFVSSSS